ncbi:hypothetical protein [Bradyrhizobium canariense]|uniref:hypothetical protein n=1 Tax=Bradyrhizobium canariense TaxID=255045 RepID=UPI0013026A06|nr:hypothetical protein [Bradyrhizobium canariense]
MADQGKALGRFSILETKPRALVGSLDPPVNLVDLCNTGCFGTKLIQLPAVGSYSQTIRLDHENTSEEIKSIDITYCYSTFVVAVD